MTFANYLITLINSKFVNARSSTVYGVGVLLKSAKLITYIHKVASKKTLYYLTDLLLVLEKKLVPLIFTFEYFVLDRNTSTCIHVRL